MDTDDEVEVILIIIASISGAALLLGTVYILCNHLRSSKKCCWSKFTNNTGILDEESGCSQTVSRASSQQNVVSIKADNTTPSLQPATSQVRAPAEGNVILLESDDEESIERSQRNSPVPGAVEWNVRPTSGDIYRTLQLLNQGRLTHSNSYHIHRSIPTPGHGSTSHIIQQAINNAPIQYPYNKTYPKPVGLLTGNQRSSFRSNASQSTPSQVQDQPTIKSTTYASVTFNGNLIKLPVSVIKPHGLPNRRNSKVTRKASSPAAPPASSTLTGPNKSLPTNTNLILAVDATPQRLGGYVINLQKNLIQYYSLQANEMPWILRNRSRQGNPTEFEMKNLFCSLLMWDNLIVSRKKVEIYTDNSAIIGKSKYGQRVRDYLKHFTDCLGVSIINKTRMYVNRTRYTGDFNKFIGPADSLSRTRVNEFEIALRRHYPTMEFQSITNFKKVKETAIYWTKNVCPDCGFCIQMTGSFKRRKNNHH